MTPVPAARAETALPHPSDAPPAPVRPAEPRDVHAGERLLEDADVERILAAV